MENKADSISRPRGHDFSWAQFIINSSGSQFDPSILRTHNFLEGTVFRTAFLRDVDLKVLTMNPVDPVRIVKNVVDDCKIVVDGGEMTISEIMHSYDYACKTMKMLNFDNIVFLDELAKTPKKIARSLIQEGQYFLYHPPGGKEYLAVVAKNRHGVMSCRLFAGEMNGDRSFDFSAEEPDEMTLVMGAVGMQPLDRQFAIAKDNKSKILSQIRSRDSSEIRQASRRDSGGLRRMPEHLFRVPQIGGEFDFLEGSVVELLNVQRNPFYAERYSPATSPHFLYATVVSCDEFTVCLRVVHEGKTIEHNVHLTEGLLYPAGTAERLGVEIQGETMGWGMDCVGGPTKYEGEEWRGYAELLVHRDEVGEFIHIRPIVIRNVHDGILAEFSFIDEMERGSFLLPLCNPSLLPCGFSKKSGIRMEFNDDRVNHRLLEHIFCEERRDRVAPFPQDHDFTMDAFEMEDNAVSVNGMENGDEAGEAISGPSTAAAAADPTVQQPLEKSRPPFPRPVLPPREQLPVDAAASEAAALLTLQQLQQLHLEETPHQQSAGVEVAAQSAVLLPTKPPPAVVQSSPRKEKESEAVERSDESQSAMDVSFELPAIQSPGIVDAAGAAGIEAAATALINQSPLESSKFEVPSKRIRLTGSPLDGGVEKTGKGDGLLPENGVSPDSSFNAYELPEFHTRRMAEASAARVRGGHPRTPFLRNREPGGLVHGGEVEMHRIQMERVLVAENLYKFCDDKIRTMDVISRELMAKFRNPMDWHSIEVHLFLDQFNVHPSLKDFVKDQQLDGKEIFSLELTEVLCDFPFLTPEPWDGKDSFDFDQKIFFFGFIDRIKKIANDPTMIFDPTPFTVDGIFQSPECIVVPIGP